jgi:hypothetical protein
VGPSTCTLHCTFVAFKESFKVCQGQYGPVWAALVPEKANNMVERQRQVYQGAELKVTVEELLMGRS